MFRNLMIAAVTVSALSLGAAAPSFAQNTGTVVQGGDGSLNTAVTNQRGRVNDSLTVQTGRNSDNLAITDQRGCTNVAEIGQGGRNSRNEAGLNQRQRRRC